MSDTELTILVMVFTLSVMGLGLWIGRGAFMAEEEALSNVKTNSEIEMSRRKLAATVAKVMFAIVAIALSKSAVRHEIEKIFTGQYSFTPEVISILVAEVLWVVVGVSLIIYSKKKVLI